MSDMFLYMVNIITVVLLVSSTAGSVLFLSIKLATDLFSGHYEVRYHYLMMRMAVLFYMLPAVVMTVWIIISKTCWNMLTFQPLDSEEKIEFLDYFGILVISEHSLNIARVFVFCVWLAGFLVFFFFRLGQERHAVRQIQKHAAEWDTEAVRKLRSRIMQETGTKKEIRIYKSSTAGTPFSAGIIHPAIYFPQAELHADDLYRILKHEYIHCIRKDILYRLFMMIIRGIHWYHPLIYLFEREFFHCSELACDEEVLKNVDTSERYCYAKLVLCMLETCTEEGQAAYGAGFVSRSEAEMKRRILHIMRGRRKAARAAVLSGMIFFAMLCPVSTYAASQAVAAVNSHIVKIAKGTASMKIIKAEYTQGEYSEPFQEPEDFDVKEVSVLAAGTAVVDASVEGSGTKSLFRMRVEEGDTVTISLDAGSRDVFRLGLRDQWRYRTRYVDSEDGTCKYIFDMFKKAECLIFVQGSGEDEDVVHVTGEVMLSR